MSASSKSPLIPFSLLTIAPDLSLMAKGRAGFHGPYGSGMNQLFKGMGGANDGLVPVSSAKWGVYKGGPSYSWWVTGIDHLQITNTLWTGQAYFDVEGFFLGMAQNAKNNQ